MRSVAVTVLLGTEMIDLGVATLSEGAFSGQWIPRKNECPREQLGDVLREKLCLMYLVVCLHEFLMRWDTCLDLGTDQKLTIIDAPSAPFFPSSRKKEWSGLIWLWLGKLRRRLYSEGTGQNTFSHSELSLKTGVGEDS